MISLTYLHFAQKFAELEGTIKVSVLPEIVKQISNTNITVYRTLYWYNTVKCDIYIDL